MAGLPWIKVWTIVGRHPKVQRLERELGIKDGLGIVVRLWCWTADFAPGGEIGDAEADDAARVARGDATRRSTGDVLASLLSVGLLDRIPGGYRVHDWDEMQTRHVEAEEKRRAQGAQRQARYRERHGDASRNASRNGYVTEGVTVTRVTREEKTREEEEKSASPASPITGDEWLAGFREKLAQRLGVPEIDIGKDRTRVLALFRQQLDAVGEDVLLTDCVAAAKLSETGVPSSLAWFVGWLKRLPTEATA